MNALIDRFRLFEGLGHGLAALGMPRTMARD
jgi:hypothetical protein